MDKTAFTNSSPRQAKKHSLFEISLCISLSLFLVLFSIPQGCTFVVLSDSATEKVCTQNCTVYGGAATSTRMGSIDHVLWKWTFLDCDLCKSQTTNNIKMCKCICLCVFLQMILINEIIKFRGSNSLK